MSGKAHTFATTVTWTGNPGKGTISAVAYCRDHEIAIDGKPTLLGSSDPAFRGDPGRHNPEELLVASLSACHMLWHLALCGGHGVVVTGYVDRAEGFMEDDASGAGRFTRVVLRPEITLAPGTDQAKADSWHHEAHEKCFVSQSVNFPVTVEATYREG